MPGETRLVTTVEIPAGGEWAPGPVLARLRDDDRAYAFMPQRAPAKVSSELGEFYSDDASRSELPGGRTAGRGSPVGAHGGGNAFAYPQLGCKRG